MQMGIGIVKEGAEVEVAVIDATDVIQRPKKNSESSKARRKRDIQ
ncbi:hypothetical protein AGMMS49990_10620 [Endomicrobiia bacterium]|nr:hypothetical protein AGMMS49990_10620 [Endomicrobiia bacterium]